MTRRRRLFVALAVAAVVIPIFVVGLGLTGAYDHYFTVTLVNRTGGQVIVDNHGDAVRLAPGARDLEWGSSTAHQPIKLQRGSLRHCVDLYFTTEPGHPLPIRLRNGHLTVERAPGC